MNNFICVTCGQQYAESSDPPPNCPVCQDERQYVNPQGHAWTTLDQLAREHHNVVKSLEPGLVAIGTEPRFAIGQRAMLVQTPQGNVLWDCISLIDDATIEAIRALGGVSCLAMSHPLMFGSMVEWSHVFGHAPILVHADLRWWVQRPDPAIEFWEGETYTLKQGVTLQRCGGHLDDSTVLWWSAGAEGRRVLLSVAPVLKFKFDRIYDLFLNLEIEAGGQAGVRRSIKRYLRAIAGTNRRGAP